MSAVAPLDAVRAALADEEAWLVGGAVRDRLLGRGPTADLDLALAGDPRAAARRARAGHRRRVLRALGRLRRLARGRAGQAWQVDLVALQGATLAEDLAARDFTVNAMAEPLAGGDAGRPARRPRPTSRRGGCGWVGRGAFDRDPLRALRVARLATSSASTSSRRPRRRRGPHAPGVAGVAAERVFAELRALVARRRRRRRPAR